MNAPQPAAMTTPVNSKRVGDQLPCICAMPNTMNMETSEPRNALPVSTNPLAPISIASKVATAAPPDIPSTYGSANGLRNKTCMSTPANAKRAPQVNAPSALGKRSSLMTCVCCDAGPLENKLIRSSEETGTLPTIKATVNATGASASNKINVEWLRDTISS